MLKRTQEEIVKRIQERKEEDFFGFERVTYMAYLDLEHMASFLDPREVIESHDPSLIDPVDEIKNYMDFTWEKANNKRGLSAGRSVDRMVAWLWLAGENRLSDWASDSDNYYHYGKPILEKICDYYGIDWKQWDNGERTNS